MTTRQIPPKVLEQYRRFRQGEKIQVLAEEAGVSERSIHVQFLRYGLLVGQESNVNDKTIKLYNFIMRFWADSGYWPSLREMMPIIKTRSTGVAASYVIRLIGWGWISRVEGNARAFKLTRVSERGLDRYQIKEWLDRAPVPEAAP